jgi:DNA-binding transcriptional ArsR family regulator
VPDTLHVPGLTTPSVRETLVMTRPGVSQHLRVLREAGIVRSSRDGRFVWYELDGLHLTEAEHWLEALADRWADAPPLRRRSPLHEKERT